MGTRKKLEESEEAPKSCVRRVSNKGVCVEAWKVTGGDVCGSQEEPTTVPQGVSRGRWAERADSGPCV